MKKVKIKSSWTSDESILNRLITQFKTSEEDTNNIQFVFDDTADLVVFFGYVNEEILPDKQYVVFPQEPSWSGNHPRNFPSNKNITVYGYDKNLYNFNGPIVESVSLMFYGGRGPESEGWEDWIYQKIKNDRPKSKIISSCVSYNGIGNESFPESCLYPKRIKLIKEIIKNTDFIDIYSWESNGRNVKGWLNKKIDGLIDYKFSLCLENSEEKNYVSEKFYDCILTDTIPIYYGCKNIKELCPEDGYILIEDIDDIDSIVKLLKNIHENHQEIYNRLIPNCRKIKERYFNEYNPLKLINKLCE
jgi:hypothetical protein